MQTTPMITARIELQRNWMSVLRQAEEMEIKREVTKLIEATPGGQLWLATLAAQDAEQSLS